MNRIIKRPQLVFLALAPIALISGFLNKGEAINIGIHDTYFVLDIWFLCLFSTIFFLMIALNYVALTYTQKKPIRILTLLHIAFQIIAFTPLLYIFYTVDAESSFEKEGRTAILFLLSFFVFFLSTLIHFINFIASLLRKKE
jgi:heme/copper-type cytochrome/quinol oxidase subunit 1